MKVKKGIEIEQVEAGFDRSVGALDELRTMQLGESLQLQSAKAHVDSREYSRLESKYGKEHPRTLEMAARIELGRDRMQAIVIEHKNAATPRPDVGDGWAADGFVRMPGGDPVAGVNVAAYDRHDRWYRELGYSCTDENGYFSIVVEKLSEKAPRPIFLRASEGNKLLPSNEIRLSPAPNLTDRVEIIIGESGGSGDCEPPGEEKRKIPPGDSEDSIRVEHDFSDWMVTGKITDSKGTGLSSLKVRVFDKDLVSDDALGEAKTDSEGVYRVTFKQEQFSDFREEYPELYLIVEDESGNTLFDGKHEATNKAGRIELIDIPLKNDKTEKKDKKEKKTSKDKSKGDE